MGQASVQAIESSVRQLLARRERLVVAVSGGADSAVLLDATVRLRTPRHHVVVASVDHGTGAAATEATAQAVSAAARHGLPAISERLTLDRHDEASLRQARWSFLRHVAAHQDAVVVTAHALDDHIETVVMRVMRGTAARGVAGLLAPSVIERPFVELRRSVIRDYASSRDVLFTEDPSNTSLSHFRNRVRHELLPAVRRVAPRFENEMIDLSRRAAHLRREVDTLAELFVVASPAFRVLLNATALSELPDDSLKLLLPSLAARAGVTLDRRGLERLAAVVRSSPGARGQLSGGYEAVRSRGEVTVHKMSGSEPATVRLRETGETRFGSFRFRAELEATFPEAQSSAANPWRIHIPRSAQPVVRQWYPGDRLTLDLTGGRRRVKRFFADAGVVGPLRTGWPVVLCGEDVVWIPGIKASQAAIPRGPGMVSYICEKDP